MLFVDIYRENENDDENSSHDFFHDNFNRENYENFQIFKTNDYRQFERQQFLNFKLIIQILIVESILKSKRFLDFHNKKRNHLKSHDWMKKH